MLWVELSWLASFLSEQMVSGAHTPRVGKKGQPQQDTGTIHRPHYAKVQCVDKGSRSVLKD